LPFKLQRFTIRERRKYRDGKGASRGPELCVRITRSAEYRDIVGIILTQNVGGRNPGIEFVNVVNAAVGDSNDTSTR
jgi:hypothetical protein